MGHSAGYLHSKYPDFFNPDGTQKPKAAAQAHVSMFIVHELRTQLREYLARMPESCRTQERLVIEDFLDWLEEKR